MIDFYYLSNIGAISNQNSGQILWNFRLIWEGISITGILPSERPFGALPGPIQKFHAKVLTTGPILDLRMLLDRICPDI